MTDKEFETVEAMIRYGGGFVQALGYCFQRADIHNFRILRAAFDFYWKIYEVMAEEDKQ